MYAGEFYIYIESFEDLSPKLGDPNAVKFILSTYVLMQQT